ncbi:MAG: oxidoreductase [Gammaproteobacteria bacterium]|nr:MAG: oxidoreductase [Gammaproteobacteria bacterium]
MAKLTIKILDKGFEFQQDEGDTLLRSALRAGLGFPYECNSGGCGSCKFELVEGELEELWPDAPGLSPRDIRKGRKLGCQCIAKSDCTIKVNLEHHSAPESKPERIMVSFVEAKPLTSDMAEFVFKSASAAKFIPGQFALLSLPGVEGDRAYSMSNLPNNEGEWSFIIKKMPGGKGSTFIFDELKLGDSIELDGPYGMAFLKTEIPREIVCIGGGSGLSPMVSIARAVTKDPQMAQHKMHMFYGGRGPKDICTPAIVSEFGDIKDRLTCYNAVSDLDLAREQEWSGATGFIHELVEKELGSDLTNYEFYFCGPPPMTKAIQKMLMVDHQVPFDQLHYDRFF